MEQSFLASTTDGIRNYMQVQWLIFIEKTQGLVREFRKETASLSLGKSPQGLL